MSFWLNWKQRQLVKGVNEVRHLHGNFDGYATSAMSNKDSLRTFSPTSSLVNFLITIVTMTIFPLLSTLILNFPPSIQKRVVYRPMNMNWKSSREDTNQRYANIKENELNSISVPFTFTWKLFVWYCMSNQYRWKMLIPRKTRLGISKYFWNENLNYSKGDE